MRPPFFKRFLVLSSIAVCLMAFIQADYAVAAKESWTSVRSRNFLLIGNASEKQIRQVAIKLEQFREVFTRLFTRIKFTTPVPTTVIVFKSDSAYRPFK